ncbi:DUF3093 domain-containing protein [Kocuria sp.]|uniref:DUF3093 domain-containing protein n=1 Tax=Kocuria sp. TaxID=1871328 RepID=UPI0026DAD852|nr:DUF3093 domain-containing protein [Kocuria sp.]MDO4919789.1 DUF3093 domain-containing protein [Kocuria sp.]
MSSDSTTRGADGDPSRTGTGHPAPRPADHDGSTATASGGAAGRSTPGSDGRGSAATGPRVAPEDAPATRAGQDGSRVRYEERLSVSWWVWLIVLFVGGTGFVAVAPISIAVGVVVALVLMVAIGLAVHLGAPRIVLTDEDLRVGRAYIEREYVGTAEALRGADAREARGPQLDGRAFMNFRVSVPDLCRIEIVDPVDPTPYWLTATRHPEELARAVNEGVRPRS